MQIGIFRIKKKSRRADSNKLSIGNSYIKLNKIIFIKLEGNKFLKLAKYIHCA